MKPVTIDRLHIEDHVRWAEDQEKLQPTFLKEASVVASHPEVMSSSQKYTPQFDLLFELEMCNQPWALFTPPTHPHLVFGKRFFSHHLFTHSFHISHKKTHQKGELSSAKEEIESLGEKGVPVKEKEISWHLVYDESEGARFEEKKREKDSHHSSSQDSSSKEEEEEGAAQERALLTLAEKIASLPKTSYTSSSLFERDKHAILNLIETIQWINLLLKQINGKKLQYQKG